MLFDFQLRALDDVIPWGEPDKQSLHWFALTDGWYWLHVGENQLLRYTEKILTHWHQEYPGDATLPYVDYQVARLWEDILQMLPYILDPLPSQLVTMLENWNRWDLRAERWIESIRDKEDDDKLLDEALDIYNKALSWWSERLLNTGYLTVGPLIAFWSDGQLIHCTWDNRDRYLDGIPVWEAQYGEVTIPIATFLEEVTSFHQRFMAAMEARIQVVKAGWSHPGVTLDLADLERQQRERSGWLAKYMDMVSTLARSSWDSVVDAIASIEASTTFRK